MSAPRELPCKEVSGLLVFYSCGETSEQETELIEAHLATCATCAAQLAEERGLHESLMEALQASEQSDTGGILLSQCRSELAEALDDLSAPPLQERWRPFGWLRRWMALRPVLSGSLLVLFGAALGAQLLPWISSRLEPASSGLVPAGTFRPPRNSRMSSSPTWPSRESIWRQRPAARLEVCSCGCARKSLWCFPAAERNQRADHASAQGRPAKEAGASRPDQR